MRSRAGLLLLLFLWACATPAPGPGASVARNPRLSNLRRAAALPWTDGGRCVVQEASQPWPVLVERCFQALDQERVRFKDPEGRCAVASAGTAALGIGVCVLAAPKIIVGAVVVLGVVVVAAAIKQALDAYAASETKPASRESLANREPEPEPSGQDVFPPVPTEPREGERRPECVPRRVGPKGGNSLHNRCADNIPFNAFRGANALVNGKAFDALQVVAGVLWEVKTDSFDTYPLELQDIVVRKQVSAFLAERKLARACGFDFRVGVRSLAHKKALEYAEPTLEAKVVLMDWC